MDFLVALPAKIDELDHVVRAEAGGIAYFGAGEGPLLWSDPYQYLALASERTSTIKLGPCVTNPVTRIAPQTANSLSTLGRLAPGRVFFGIGAANNAMRSMGRAPASWAEVEHHVDVVKGLLAGERVVHSWSEREGDREVEFLAPEQGWLDVDHEVEVWVAAGGPKSLAVAARTADVVLYCLGPDPTLTRVVRDQLDEACAAAGRDPSEVKLAALTWFYEMQPGDTLDDAITKGFGSGPISSCITNGRFMAANVDKLGEDIVSAATTAAGTYLSMPPDGSTHYLDIWRKYLNGLDPRHKDIITKQLVDYFCLYGNPEELQEKIAAMRDAGVDLVAVFLANPMTFERDIDAISRSVVAYA